MLCKHPEEACYNMTFYHRKTYCDNQNGFCQLYDEFPPRNNADYIRSMNDEEMAEWLVYKVKCTGCNAENCDKEFCLNLMRELIESQCDVK